MTIPKVSQEAREAAQRFARSAWHLFWPDDHARAMRDADDIKAGLCDNWGLVQSFAQFEQLIRSKVIDEAAGDAMAYAEAAGRARCAKPGDEQAEWYWAGKASAAREIASSIRQLGESGRP